MFRLRPLALLLSPRSPHPLSSKRRQLLRRNQNRSQQNQSPRKRFNRLLPCRSRPSRERSRLKHPSRILLTVRSLFPRNPNRSLQNPSQKGRFNRLFPCRSRPSRERLWKNGPSRILLIVRKKEEAKNQKPSLRLQPWSQIQIFPHRLRSRCERISLLARCQGTGLPVRRREMGQGRAGEVLRREARGTGQNQEETRFTGKGWERERQQDNKGLREEDQ